MSNAISGVGTEFRRWNASTGEWESIAEVNSINGPGMSRETIDTTSLDTTGGYRTFIASFRDPGTVTMNMNFTRDTYDQMKADFEDDTAQNYEVVLPDAETSTIEFEGFVTELPISISAADKVSADVTIKVTGQVSVNSGSGPSAGA